MAVVTMSVQYRSFVDHPCIDRKTRRFIVLGALFHYIYNYEYKDGTKG